MDSLCAMTHSKYLASTASAAYAALMPEGPAGIQVIGKNLENTKSTVLQVPVTSRCK